MATIIVAGPQDSNDQVIKKFKKKILQSGLLDKIREKQEFKKPSLVRKEKKDEFRRRRKRRLQANRRRK